jgi:hypothetical protein
MEPVVREVVHPAINRDPKTVPDPHQAALDAARKVRERVTGNFAVGRFIAAMMFLALWFAGGVLPPTLLS